MEEAEFPPHWRQPFTCAKRIHAGIPLVQGAVCQVLHGLGKEKGFAMPEMKNTNKWDTRTLVTMALLAAIGILLSFIEFPLFAAAPFLKLDVSFVPSAVVGFAYGPVAGVVVGIIVAVAHAMIDGNWVGAIMNTVMVLSFVLPASLVYKRNRTFKGAIIGLLLGLIIQTAVSVPANMAIDPLYGVDASIVLSLAGWIVAFNVVKGIVNSVLTGVVYKSISNLITPKKNQVKGR